MLRIVFFALMLTLASLPAFAVTPAPAPPPPGGIGVPGPIAGAGLPILVIGGGYYLVRRWRRRQGGN